MIHKITDEFELLLDIERKHLHIEVIVNDLRFERVSKQFQSLKQLSASLACELGLGPAKALLLECNIPYESDLWDLNHSNPWKQY